MSEELVLTVPAKLLHKCGYFQGFQPIETTLQHQRYAPLLDRCEHSVVARSLAETDPTLKQLIPYVVVVDGARGIATYWRGTGQGESRLHGKRSLGFGGHINPGDLDHDDEASFYAQGLVRELQEELIFVPEPDVIVPTVLGLLNDDSNDVGKVHLGVVHYLELPADHTIQAREPDILSLEFNWLTGLSSFREQFEPWSQLCLDELQTRAMMAIAAEREECSYTE